MSAVSGTLTASMIRTPRRVSRRTSSSCPPAVARVSRGRITTTTERNSTDPPIAEISR
jgi:hypothetical protein